MTAHELRIALRKIYGAEASTGRAHELTALKSFADNPAAEDWALLRRYELADIVQAVLMEGKTLAEAGLIDGGMRYRMRSQAHAYTVAKLQTAGRVLMWAKRERVAERGFLDQRQLMAGGSGNCGNGS